MSPIISLSENLYEKSVMNPLGRMLIDVCNNYKVSECNEGVQAGRRKEPDQESAIKRTTKSTGIFEITKERFIQKYKDDYTKWIPGTKVLPESCFFVHQPNGTQKTPDFFFIIWGFFFPLDCKSTKNNKVMWNSGLPEHKIIYILSNKSGNFLFLGEHLVEDTEREILAERDMEIRIVCDKVNENLSDIGSSWAAYHRKANDEQIDYAKLSLEKNSRREVLQFIEDSICGNDNYKAYAHV